jgi:hypothetical protein
LASPSGATSRRSKAKKRKEDREGEEKRRGRGRKGEGGGGCPFLFISRPLLLVNETFFFRGRRAGTGEKDEREMVEGVLFMLRADGIGGRK